MNIQDYFIQTRETKYKPMALVSDCCGATPWSIESAEINGYGVCSECKEDCLYITQQEFDEKNIKNETEESKTNAGGESRSQVNNKAVE